MKVVAVAVLLCLAATCTSASDGHVLALNADNFDEVVKDPSMHVFVKFYTPWCSHCQEVAPEWEQLSARLVDRPDIIVAELNAEDFKDLAHAEGVRGFPTFKLYSKQGKAGIPFKGQSRTTAAFENFARRLAHY